MVVDGKKWSLLKLIIKNLNCCSKNYKISRVINYYGLVEQTGSIFWYEKCRIRNI